MWQFENIQHKDMDISSWTEIGTSYHNKYGYSPPGHNMKCMSSAPGKKVKGQDEGPNVEFRTVLLCLI